MSGGVAEDGSDCWPCRLTSGFGVMAIGAYLYSQSHKQGRMGKLFLTALSAGAVGIGVARLFNMQFLKSQNTNAQRKG